MARVIGIDLGTTNSVVACLDAGRLEVIPNSEGAKTTPSVVLYRPNEDPIVGELAKRQILTQGDRAVRSVKRLIGKRFEEAQPLIHRFAYKIAADSRGDAEIRIDDKRLSPVEISSHILMKMRRTAMDFLGEDVTQAVVTVPAHFNDSQRQATKEAAQLAGIEVMRIINEPTAAALAYGLGRETSERIAVFDFGGGTFDVSILEVEEEVFEVRSTHGDNELGGDNIDELLADHISDWILAETQVDPRTDVAALQRIREAAEKAKCELSILQQTTLALPFIVADASGPKHFNRDFPRTEFEEIIKPIMERLAHPCLQALEDAQLKPTDIDNVILVGGSTRIPAVQAMAREIFKREPSRAVNPDEAVALGAAIQAGVISGEIEEVLLLDVTPLSLGIEVEGGLFRTLIPRNSSIPTSASRNFTTTQDGQISVNVHVLQGERASVVDNRSLAHIKLTGLAPSPSGVPEIEVTFSIDADGILSVSALDLTSGAHKAVVVESYKGELTHDAKRMVEEAEAKQEEDRQFEVVASMKQKALSTQRMVAAFLRDSLSSISEDDAETFQKHMFRLDVAMAANDGELIAKTESELLKLGDKYSDLFYLHKMTEEAME